MPPVVCMITDRMRLQSGGGEDGSRESLLVRRVQAAARAGVHLVQVRERDLDGGLLLRLVLACLDAVRATSTRIIVNERLDVALAAGAHGVHLRGESMPAARVRSTVPPGFLIGRSVHSNEEAAQVDAGGGADYLIFGPVFATRSKPAAVPARVASLAAAVAATRLPVIAVGGVTAANAGNIRTAGAAGFAAIGLFAEGDADRLPARVAAASAAFESGGGPTRAGGSSR